MLSAREGEKENMPTLLQKVLPARAVATIESDGEIVTKKNYRKKNNKI